MLSPRVSALAAAFLLFASVPVRDARAFGEEFGFSPLYDWKTLETEHFRISFPAEMSAIAQRTANLYEEAHELLSPLLQWQPRWRTQVVLVDNTDFANGLTTPITRIGMVLMITPPENWFSTANYDDWLRLLVLHEYTHFLNMDATRELWEAFRWILGDLLLPNSVWPTWMLEGLAVYTETRFTRAGRGRSPYYEMILRAAVEENALDSEDFITLDRVNGGSPYHPAGEVAYLFGYQLLNQVARDIQKNPRNGLSNGYDVLGTMSERSSGRIPFFINGNLENLTGRDWYSYWESFATETRARMIEQIERIRSEPVTPVKPLTTAGFEARGPVVSRNGRWLAYSHESLEHRDGLYVRNLDTGETRRILDKIAGVGLAFTPDSRRIVYSSIERRDKYSLFSDLHLVEFESGREARLTTSLRARDPDLSADGRLLAFTLTEGATTGLATAPLDLGADGKARVGEVRKLYWPQALDLVSNPRFSPDGRRIVFSLHRNGSLGEELVEVNTETGKPLPLVSNGARNRYPAFSPAGELYFISDASGVDNLYRLGQGSRPVQVTNVITGLTFPSFGPSGGLYASHFTTRGWNIAQIGLTETDLPTATVRTERVRVSPTTAPAPEDGSPPKTRQTEFQVKDYSAFPSILPRLWAPVLSLDGSGIYFGGMAQGFDAVDRHRYSLGVAYDTTLGQPDLALTYANRSLGPTLTLGGTYQTIYAGYFQDAAVECIKRASFSAGLSYPILWTYSSLTPFFVFSATRDYAFTSDPGSTLASDRSFSPQIDAILSFSNAAESRLAISTEQGRTTTLGVRNSFGLDAQAWKVLLRDDEHLRITDHSVLVPSVRAAYANRTRLDSRNTSVYVQGRLPRILGRFSGDSLDGLDLRGYPVKTFSARAASVASLDYRFPLLRIYRGWGTNPAFLENLYGVAFAETAYFPLGEPGRDFLPSAGAGLRLTSDLFIHVPILLAVEYHHGFATPQGGTGELFLALNMGRLGF